MSTLNRNIRSIFTYGFFLNFLVMIPVLVPYWQQKGLSLKEVFLLQGIFGMALIIFDAPAGYLADMFGRKRSLVVGSFISALGFQVLWWGDSFWDFALMELILGLGLSMQMGADVAILYNTLDRNNYQGSRTKLLGMRLTAITMGEGIASLLCGYLASYSIMWPIYANGVVCWIPLFAALAIKEEPGQKLPRGSHIENFKSIGKALFGHSRLLTYVIFSFIFYGFATYCAVWIFQPYWKEKGLDISMFGYLWAINSFMVALVSRYAHAIEVRIGSVASVVLIALLPIVGYLGMGMAGGMWGILFVLAFPLCRGLNQVLFQDAINSRVPAEMRATTNSVGGLGMRALFLVFGPVIGASLDHKGIEHTLILLGVIYLVGFFAVALPLLSQRRYFRTN